MAGEEKDFVIRDKRSSANPDSPDSPDSVEEKGQEVPEHTGVEENSKDKASDQKASAPEITFSTFILSLSSSAAMNLGEYQDPVSGHVSKNLELAKQSIDILGLLHEKTRGNLSDEEAGLLDSALYELRMRYVEEIKKSSK